LEFTHQKVRDSKTLSALQRQHQLAYFQTANFTFQTFSADSTQIDRQGIGPVITTLFTQALTFFHGRFDFAIIDGNLDIFSSSSLKRGLKGISLPKADTLCFSVAAASIVAKVDRDTQMIAAHSLYPIYGFNQNMGYGTALHHQGLKTHGPCPLHRRSYKPISQYL
jgi:ribonuclease HII